MIFLVDICDTLYKSNTTFDFIEFSLEGHPLRQFFFRLINSRWSPAFFFLIFLNRIFKRDFHKRMTISLLSNQPKNVLESSAARFYQTFLERRRNEKVWSLLTESGANQVVLISSTLEPIAKVIAQHHGFNFRASELEYSQSGLFTGRLKKDLTGKKHLLVPELTANNTFTVITDNESDRQLLARAAKKIVVLTKPGSEHKWKNFDADFVRNYE